MIAGPLSRRSYLPDREAPVRLVDSSVPSRALTGFIRNICSYGYDSYQVVPGDGQLSLKLSNQTSLPNHALARHVRYRPLGAITDLALHPAAYRELPCEASRPGLPAPDRTGIHCHARDPSILPHPQIEPAAFRGSASFGIAELPSPQHKLSLSS